MNQITPTPAIRFVPNLPDYIKGALDIDEQIVPIIDLKKKLNLTAQKEQNTSFLLVFESDGYLVAFEVDDIFEIVETKSVPKKEFTYISEDIHIFSNGTFRFKREDFGVSTGPEEELVILLSLKKVHDVIKRELVRYGD